MLLATTDPALPWTWTFIAITFAIYLFIGWRSRVKETAGFYVAGQGVPAIANGAATAADWMSAASFIGMAGLISFSGSDGSVYLMGWTGGYVLLALLLAPYLRKFGHYTVPDFIGARYYSETARIVAAICAIFVSLTYVAGQMKGVGVVFSRFLEVDLAVGVCIGMAIVAFFAVLGGMKGITWTQVVQYFVLILAFIIPSVAISSRLTGDPIPQTAFAFSDISERLNHVLIGLGHEAYTTPFTKFGSSWNVFLITAALMFGTAGLPHVIVRFYTVKDVRAARYSAVWAILFIALLYTSAPALGLFARYNLINSMHESKIDRIALTGSGDQPQVFEFPAQRVEAFAAIEQATADNANAKADGLSEPNSIVYFLSSKTGQPLDWASRWQNTGLLKFEDLNQDGEINLTLVSRDDGTRRSELAKIDRDIIVLSTPEVADLPPWVIALVAAGGLAAALSTAAGLLLVISSSLAHDLYIRFFEPNATEARKLLVGRIAIIFGILIAGYFGIYPPGFVGEVVAFAFGLAAASFFPAIFLGIFSKRVNRAGAVTGMIVGLAFTSIYIVLCTANKVLPFLFEAPLLTKENWLFGISPQGIGTVGMAINFLLTLIISAVTPPPPAEVIELIESVRIPSGTREATEH
jgi:cation/acetate symporter